MLLANQHHSPTVVVRLLHRSPPGDVLSSCGSPNWLFGPRAQALHARFGAVHACEVRPPGAARGPPGRLHLVGILVWMPFDLPSLQSLAERPTESRVVLRPLTNGMSAHRLTIHQGLLPVGNRGTSLDHLLCDKRRISMLILYQCHTLPGSSWNLSKK